MIVASSLSVDVRLHFRLAFLFPSWMEVAVAAVDMKGGEEQQDSIGSMTFTR